MDEQAEAEASLRENVMRGFNKMKKERPELLAKTLEVIPEGVTVEGFEAWLDSKIVGTKENGNGK